MKRTKNKFYDLFKSLSISDYISIANILILVLAGTLGYVFVDRVKIQFEEIRKNREQTELIQLKATLISQIRPKISISYISLAPLKGSSNEVGYKITIKNNGLHHVFLKDGVYSLMHAYGKSDVKESRKWEVDSPTVKLTEPTGQGIPPGGEDTIEVRYYFRQDAILKKYIGIYSVDVISDPLMLDILRDIFPADYPFEKVEKLATYHVKKKLTYGDISASDFNFIE
jgi:hypothetical protein